MKAALFIIILILWQEPVKVDTVKAVPKLNIDSTFRTQNMKLDSIIATKNAEFRYNFKDTIK
jgi:hypothetical protein